MLSGAVSFAAHASVKPRSKLMTHTRPVTRPRNRPFHRGSTVGFAVPVRLALLLLPFFLAVAAIMRMFRLGQSADRNTEEVAGFLRDFIEDRGDDWDWDEFESVTITDPELEALRLEAVEAGPRERREDADFEKLRTLLARTEAIDRADKVADAAADRRA